ncbi:hypothetical protein [Gordonia liuliyuniae]|uniref:DUF3263 domain-containing protein n=1 Tax=Gordonia liuliyuniae TaxID=2911517 RepID=A0ABS9IUX9_9ACTN|nr:hypothetical protein [Gordonia liuliyuniae]MCF8589371.1 hypothetical protein [Gordonia liuliyuniae]
MISPHVEVDQPPPVCRAFGRHTLSQIEALERDAIVSLGLSRATIYQLSVATQLYAASTRPHGVEGVLAVIEAAGTEVANLHRSAPTTPSR